MGKLDNFKDQMKTYQTFVSFKELVYSAIPLLFCLVKVHINFFEKVKQYSYTPDCMEIVLPELLCTCTCMYMYLYKHTAHFNQEA